MGPAQVFPPGPDPLPLAAGGATAFTGFRETLGPAPDGSPGEGMVVLVARGGGASSAAAPGFRIRAGGGEVVVVDRFPQGTEVHDGDGNALGQVDYKPLADGVFEIELFVTRPGNAWELEITNTDNNARTFTWVAAATIAEATRPWVVVTPARLELSAEAGASSDAQAVDVENHGTGPLTVAMDGPTDPDITAELDGTARVGPGDATQLDLAFAPPADAVAGTVTRRYVVQCDDDTAAHTHRTVDLVATTTVPPPREVEVAFLALLPPSGDVFRQRIKDDNLVGAMTTVCASPLALGTAVYPPGGGAPTDPGAIGAIAATLAAGVQGEFPDLPVYTRATWLALDGGPGTPPDAVLRQRRDAAVAATTEAEVGAIDPGPLLAAMPAAAFDVARRTGIPQQAIMVVEVVLGPVIDSLDHDSRRWTVTGRNLQLHPGDGVAVWVEWDVDAQRGESIDADSIVVDGVTPTQVTFLQPRFEYQGGRDHVDGVLFLERPDGTQAFDRDDFGVGIL